MFLLIILLQMILASAVIVSKALLEVVPPFALVGIRMSIGGSLLLLATAIFNPSAYRIRWVNLIPLFSATLFGIFLTNVLEAWGLRYTIASKAYFIFNLSPFFAALLGFIFFHEKMTRNKWIGLIVGFVGFFPLIFNDLLKDHAFLNTLPEFAILCASAATVIGWISKKKLIMVQNFSVMLANGISMFIGGIGALLLSVLFEQPNWYDISHTPEVYGLFTLSVTLTCLLGYNLYGYLLNDYSATYTTLSGFLGTLFSAILGWWFLGEHVTVAFWVAFIIVAFGVGIFHREEIKS